MTSKLSKYREVKDYRKEWVEEVSKNHVSMLLSSEVGNWAKWASPRIRFSDAYSGLFSLYCETKGVKEKANT